MRRRLTLFVAACTSAVLVAFLVPLALLLRQLAEETALQAGTQLAQSLAISAATHGDVNDFIDTQLPAEYQGHVTVWLADGSVAGPRATVPADDAALREAREKGQTVQRDVSGGRVIAVPVVSAPSSRAGTAARATAAPIVVRVVITDAQLHHNVTYSTSVIAGLGLLLTAASIFAADRLARRVVAPIHQVAMAADAMREGRLDVPVPETGPEEVVALGRALNRLAARITQLLASERDAVADLSHRLRTPVTALRLDVESVEDHELALRLRGHLAQLERTVDAIVHGARRPGRSASARHPACDVGKVVAERVQFWSALADDQARSLQIGLPQQRLMARLDAGELADVVDVLIDNVFAHTEDGVPIEVWVAPRADGLIAVTVEDGGPGLPSVDVVVRGASGRGSSGLGLDIARRASLASGGSMELGQSGLGGALVRVLLGPAEE